MAWWVYNRQKAVESLELCHSTHRDVGAGEVATNCGASEESRLSPVLRQFAAK